MKAASVLYFFFRLHLLLPLLRVAVAEQKPGRARLPSRKAQSAHYPQHRQSRNRITHKHGFQGTTQAEPRGRRPAPQANAARPGGAGFARNDEALRPAWNGGGWAVGAIQMGKMALRRVAGSSRLDWAGRQAAREGGEEVVQLLPATP